MKTNNIAMQDVTPESHISSFIVYCQASKHSLVEQLLQSISDIEIHGSDEEGKFVVVTEAKHQGIILDRIDQVSAIDGVINVSLVYHQVIPIDELDDEFDADSAQKPIEELYQPKSCNNPAFENIGSACGQ